MVSMLVCVVVENVSVGVDVNHVLKFRVDDEVDCVGECLSKMKLNTKVALFYKLSDHPSSGLETSRNRKLCSQSHNRFCLFGCLHPGRAFQFQKKDFEIRL